MIEFSFMYFYVTCCICGIVTAVVNNLNHAIKHIRLKFNQKWQYEFYSECGCGRLQVESREVRPNVDKIKGQFYVMSYTDNPQSKLIVLSTRVRRRRNA